MEPLVRYILKRIVSLVAKSKKQNMNISEDDFLKAEIENFNLTFENPDFVALARRLPNTAKSLNPKAF